MQKSALVIAIDGPSASGKSTVSRFVARHFNFYHVDSGALYRGVTWFFLKKRIKLDDDNVIAAALQEVHVDFRAESNTILFTINGIEPGEELRSERVNENVSQVAASPVVRTWVVHRLRQLLSFGNLVMEGRDIGTAVFPDAAFKFYLDAAPEERARRRAIETGGLSSYDAVMRSLARRDTTDSTRACHPLRAARDAIVIQTTHLSIEQVVEVIINTVSRKEG